MTGMGFARVGGVGVVPSRIAVSGRSEVVGSRQSPFAFPLWIEMGEEGEAFLSFRRTGQRRRCGSILVLARESGYSSMAFRRLDPCYRRGFLCRNIHRVKNYITPLPTHHLFLCTGQRYRMAGVVSDTMVAVGLACSLGTVCRSQECVLLFLRWGGGGGRGGVQQ